MIRAPRASPTAATIATSAAIAGALGAERLAERRQPAERDHAAGQGADARTSTHAITVVRSRPAYPAGASVSTIENPHGDHAPVTPATSPASATTAISI